jgi:hypothetical protein
MVYLLGFIAYRALWAILACCGVCYVLLPCWIACRVPCDASKTACVAFSPSRLYSHRGCGLPCACEAFSLVPWILACDAGHPTHPYSAGVFNFAGLPHPSDIRIIVKQS